MMKKCKVDETKLNRKVYRPNMVAILGIDTFRGKNISQIEQMNKHGYIFDVFTNDSFKDSSQQFRDLAPLNRLFQLNGGFLSRIQQLMVYFWKHRTLLHHAEIYPAGRFAVFYSLLCKCFKIKRIVVERGDLRCLIETPVAGAYIDQFVYKSSSVVWYKEPYMEALLKRVGVKHCTMIENAVDIPNTHNTTRRNIDFLWVNRVIKGRNFDWLVHCLHNQRAFKTVSIGYMHEHTEHLPIVVHQLLEDLKGNDHFEVHGYVEPHAFYGRARFFILPADLVFGNFSLLEAMSYGVIPIVSETDATNKIVQDGVNGIVFKHDYASFAAAIDKAVNMDERTCQQLSSRARQTIYDDFSLTTWSAKMISLYSELES